MVDTEIRLSVHLLRGKSCDTIQDDLLKVKELSHKLELSTKRRSILQWQNAMKERQLNGLLPAQFAEVGGLETIPEHHRSKDNVTRKTIQISAPGNSSNACPDELQELQSRTDSDETGERASSENKLSENDSAVNSVVKLTPPQRSNHSGDVQNSSSADVSSSSKKQTICTDKQEPDEKERYRRISEALSNIRKDLVLMRLEDHRIARKLLNIREELNRQKATEICNEHAAMLDDFSWQIEEEEELNEKLKVSDLSSALVRRSDSLLWSSSPLRHLGLSKRSMDFRRFSVI
ncbi:unnamed protein product [Clavelina lepadiformis]|uniref:Uncharacterized protein n=1 Tax=Clavelina lepadiformis TaxID=159417 RepID=A0ABP0H028_CLALP